VVSSLLFTTRIGLGVMAEKKWMQHAVKPSHKGKFTAKAEAAGKSVAEYAKEKEHAPGALGKEARLAEVFEGEAHKEKHKKTTAQKLYPTHSKKHEG
jgi:hypothetical protein